MPYRRPDRLFLAVFTVAAPGILVLAGLVIFGVLSPVAALAAAAVAFALAGIIAWRHATDLARLRLRVDQLAAGENDPGYEATTVGDLSLAIARLGRQWQDEREKLAAERATADYILDALPDPLIVVDKSGMVVRANNAAEEIFETELTGRDLAAGLRHPILLRAVGSALSDGNSLAEEIAMPPPMNRNYSALVEPLGESADSGALILLHDLTPVRLGERMRADFVANVSHELRTPLSSLLGFVETLRGPPPTSGTRDAFNELAIEGGCKTFKSLKAVKKKDKKKYKAICRGIREDGAYIEAGENDSLIVQKLEANPSAFGVFGYSFLDQNADKVQGSLINNVEPTFENISAQSYPVSRALFFYVKKAHVGKIAGIKEYVSEFTSDKAWGPEGYLADRGLIPLPDSERKKVRASSVGMADLSM